MERFCSKQPNTGCDSITGSITTQIKTLQTLSLPSPDSAINKIIFSERATHLTKMFEVIFVKNKIEDHLEGVTKVNSKDHKRSKETKTKKTIMTLRKGFS